MFIFHDGGHIGSKMTTFANFRIIPFT